MQQLNGSGCRGYLGNVVSNQSFPLLYTVIIKAPFESTRTSLKRSPKVLRRPPRRRRTKEKWASVHTTVRAIILRALVWRRKLTCWPKSWRTITSPFLIAQRIGKEDQIQRTERDRMPWLLAHQERDCLLEGCNEPCIFYDTFGIVEPTFGSRNWSIPAWNQSTSVQVCLIFSEQVQHEILKSKEESLSFRS